MESSSPVLRGKIRKDFCIASHLVDRCVVIVMDLEEPVKGLKGAGSLSRRIWVREEKQRCGTCLKTS